MTDATSEAIVAMVSFPHGEAAQTVATALIAAGAAACVQAFPITSTYSWKGDVNSDSEILIIVKGLRSKLDSIKRIVLDNHPYDVAEIVILPVIDVNPPYLAWMREVAG